MFSGSFKRSYGLFGLVFLCAVGCFCLIVTSSDAQVVDAESAIRNILCTRGNIEIGLHLGNRDSEFGGRTPVSTLQKFLLRYPQFYPRAEVTGYFGSDTENAVKAYQSAYGIISSGSWETTGFGGIGPATAHVMNGCESSITTSRPAQATRPISYTTQVISKAEPYGALGIRSCAAREGESCAATIGWSTKNSIYLSGESLANITITNLSSGSNGTNTTATYQNLGNPNGSHTFSVTQGNYRATLRGWSDGKYVLLDSEDFKVSEKIITITPYVSPSVPIDTSAIIPYQMIPAQVNTETPGVISPRLPDAPSVGVFPGLPSVTGVTNTNGTVDPNAPLPSIATIRDLKLPKVKKVEATSPATLGLPFPGMGTTRTTTPQTTQTTTTGTQTTQTTQGTQTTTASTNTAAVTPPTGTVTASSCTPAVVGGTCAVSTTWSTQNSIFEGSPFSVVNIVDTSNNQFYGGSAVAGTSYYQVKGSPNGSYAFNLRAGNYSIQLYGWANGAYKLLASKSISISDPLPQNVNPAGTLSVSGCTPGSVGGSCDVSVSWTTQNSFLTPGVPLGVVNVIDNAIGNYVGGSAVSGVSFFQDTTKANSSHTFSLKKGSYTFALYGWYNNAYVLLSQKSLTISDPASSGGSSSGGNQSSSGSVSVNPTGSLSASGCTTSSVGGTCAVPTTWSSQNSFYTDGSPYTVVNVIDLATNGIYGGTWIQGTSQYTGQASGSWTFNLRAGSYALQLYGWSNGGYVALDQKIITVSNSQGAAAITGSAAAITKMKTLLENIASLLYR